MRAPRTPTQPPSGDPALEEPDLSSDGLDKLRWIVPDPLLEHDLHISHIRDARRRIPGDHDQIGVLSDSDRSRPIAASQERRAIQGADADRFQWREAALD